ncbi:MAG: hypothetical protein ACLQU1_05130 [Bryobacteraceae bacterium]
MPFCGTCGAPVEGRFCAKCGGAVAGTADPAASGPGAPAAAGGLTDNAASALCYVLTFITGIIFLVLEPYSKNRTVRFHAFQAIFLGVGIIVFDVAFGLIVSILHLYALSFLLPLVGLGFFILWLYMIFSAYQGKTVVLPIIGPLAQQQK